jgi:hypothetical protein
MSAGGQRLRGWLRGREPLSEPAFIPLLTGLAARAGCEGLSEMQGDAATWTSCLMAAATLFDLDAVVAGYRPDLMLQAHRSAEGDPLAPPAVQTALETMRRVFHGCAQERVGVAAFSGPLTLAAQIESAADVSAAVECADVKNTLVKIVEAACDARPDLVLLVETAPQPGVLSPAYRRLFQTLRNVASYFDIPLGILLEGYEPEELELYLGLGLDLSLLGRSRAGDYPGLDPAGPAAASAGPWGVVLPLAEGSAASLIARAIARERERGQGAAVFALHEPTAYLPPASEPGRAMTVDGVGQGGGLCEAAPAELLRLIADIDAAGSETGR